MNSSIIYYNICSLIHRKCHPKSYHSDSKYLMTLNSIVQRSVKLVQPIQNHIIWLESANKKRRVTPVQPARDLWFLHKFIHCEGENTVNYIITLEIDPETLNYSSDIKLEYISPQSCRGILLLEPLHPRWMSLYGCYKSQAGATCRELYNLIGKCQQKTEFRVITTYQILNPIKLCNWIKGCSQSNTSCPDWSSPCYVDILHVIWATNPPQPSAKRLQSVTNS